MLLRAEIAALLARQIEGLGPLPGGLEPLAGGLMGQAEAVMRRLESDGFCFLIVRHQSNEDPEISAEIVDGLKDQSKINPSGA